MTKIARRLVREPVKIEGSLTAFRNNEVQLMIDELVSDVYTFLSDTDWNDRSCFYSFPVNCCFYSTFFTGLLFESIGLECALWVFGYRETTGAHVWCEFEDLIIDLTAAQYEDCSKKFILERKTKEINRFTKSFNIIDKGIFDGRFRHLKYYSDMRIIVERFIALNKKWDLTKPFY